jgi:hypothetical protein
MANHAGGWALGALVRFGSLDFIVTAEGGLEQVRDSIPPLCTIDLDSVVEALEELQLRIPEAHATGSSRPFDSNHKGLQRQLSTFLGTQPTQDHLRCVLFSLANIMAQLSGGEPLSPEISVGNVPTTFSFDFRNTMEAIRCLAAPHIFLSPMDYEFMGLTEHASERFAWTSEAQEALDKFKELVTKAPFLAPPIDREPLLLYIAATTQVVSAALVVEQEEEGHALKVQRPMYFISRVLTDSKTRYPQIRKLPYTVLIAKRKLHRYFKSHPVMVVMSFPLGKVARTSDATGRIAKWALKLMGQGILDAPRTATKSQTMADFIVEWTGIQMPPAAIDKEC